MRICIICPNFYAQAHKEEVDVDLFVFVILEVVEWVDFLKTWEIVDKWVDFGAFFSSDLLEVDYENEKLQFIK